MPYSMECEGNGAFVLVAFCADVVGTGGLYAFDGAAVERIDQLNCCGGTSSPDRFLRLLWSMPGENTGIMVYDRTGLLAYRRLDGHGDAHDLARYRDGYILASTSTNSVVTLNSHLEPIDQWTAPGQGDAWHINGVFVRGEQVFVSAFGRFSGERDWLPHRTDGSGLVFDLATGEDVVTGLSAPHNPRLIGGRWVVCSSGLHRLLVIDPASQERIADIDLGGWTRGIAATDSHIYVGISAPRHDPTGIHESARIAVVCRQTFKLLEMIPLPALEIGALCLVSADLFAGCRLSGAALDPVKAAAAAHGAET